MKQRLKKLNPKLLKWKEKSYNEWIGYIDNIELIDLFQLTNYSWKPNKEKRYWFVRTCPKTSFPSNFLERKYYTLNGAKKAGEKLYNVEFEKMIKLLNKIGL